jgi:hypothetical protein
LGNEVDEDFGSEIQDLDKLTQEFSMSYTAQGGVTINNLFILMEVDGAPNHTED